MKNTQSLLSEIRQANTERTWSDEELRALPRDRLHYIVVWNGIATAVPKGSEDYFRDKKITLNDQTAATRIYSQSSSRSIAHVRPESSINTTGGSFLWGPTEVKKIGNAKEVESRPNAVIPARFDEKETYPNVQNLACFASQIVHNKDAKWVPNVQIQVWLKALSKSNLHPEALIQIAQTFCIVLNRDRVWVSMTKTVRNGVTGPESLVFVREALDRLTPAEYDQVNTRTVMCFYQPYIQDGDDWWRAEVNGVPVIPEEAYEKKEDFPASAHEEVQKDGMPMVMWYKGGFFPALSFPPVREEMDAAKACSARMMELLGGDSTASALLYGMKDFSGLTDDFGKRMCFIVSMTLTCWQLNREVDIQLTSVGDVAMLYSSLTAWKKYFIEKKVPWAKDDATYDSVRFVLPQLNDKMNVHSVFHPVCTYQYRKGTVVIMWNKKTLPTPSVKGTKLDYDVACLEVIPGPVWENDFIVYSIVFGQPFFHPITNSVTLSSQTTTLPKLPKIPYVYEFSSGAAFLGVISTFPSLKMTGYGQKQVNEDEYEHDVTIHQLPLKLVPSVEKWYAYVCVEAQRQSVYFLAPISRYSPISNVVSMSKTGAATVRITIAMEKGQIVGNNARVKQKEVGRGQKLILSSQSSKPVPPPNNSSNSSNSSNSNSSQRQEAPARLGKPLFGKMTEVKRAQLPQEKPVLDKEMESDDEQEQQQPSSPEADDEEVVVINLKDC